MKKLIPFCLSLALLASVVSIFSASGTSAQTPGLVSSLFNRMDRNQRSLKSLRANVSMTKYNSQIRDTDTYQGIVLYIPGAGGASAFVRLEWMKPQNEILAVANGSYDLYKPRQNVVYRGKTNKVSGRGNNDVLALMNMSTAQLRAKFGELEDYRVETLWGGVWTEHFKATPKTGASYKYIEVWVDKEGMPVQTKMVEKNNDSTTLRLTNVERNASIPMHQFKLNLDSNVKVIKG
jgi:outer membrane lipoprotein-sorting protein